MDPVAAGDDGAAPKPTENPVAERPSKRKMKSPFQLEVLEKTYAAETYPSEALRAELSQKIGLTDRQLQMWFCHRRLKDRKCPVPGRRARMDEDSPPPPPLPALPALPAPPAPPVHDAMASPMGSSSGGYEARRGVGRVGRVAVPRIRGDVGQVGVKHYYDAPPMMLAQPMAPQLSAAELRVIASVEQQLREPLREEGPILGVEFEPLPPGAFGAPIVTGQQKQPVRPYDDKLYERHGIKMFKASTLLPSMEPSFLPSSSSGKRKNAAGGSLVHPPMGSRSLHEYQFLPALPSIQSESYERGPRFYDSPVVAPNVRVSSLPSSGPYLHDNEKVAPAYTFQSQMSSAKVMPQQGRQQTFASGPMEYDSAPQSSSFTDTVTHAQTGIPRMIGSEAPYLSSDGRMLDDDDTSQIDRKRKGDEVRIAKEFEVSEKRMRKDLEKQDTMRKKREEQMRKEMEKHDRERRKEEERLLRERQREEERYHREQRRELERREKFLQKESLRAEKLRQKEEMRREKEAAKLKAANEKATARRIAKESLELIEDERLELMELAAASKGLSSIISLDSDTVENLELFRDMLSTFPPKSVQLKRPFALQPWTTSEENIGNLLMVWKFLVTFADVLGPLWAVNLDEFVQSLYDYDSKLLGEIHVTLLKTIIKDIEDVARTPATALGANQSSAANPGGGHPHIVEGAYAWGFDIRSWQRHLSPLTWPEILRQFALSAGFGPPLKKRDVEHTYFRDNNQGNVGEDVISTLRNGAAAENAVAWMQERGYSHRRRSRHRLTPGTVKFAAFHILSLEGSKGLTILEVADKIQKSRLRDLSTSKTPEASIAAALSRDTKLFERTAPSTYCVRSPFRKDPADADAILTAARDKIQIFASGLSDSDEAEKDVEDAEDAERDEDSEGDVADDPEVDDASAKLKLAQSIPNSTESKDVGPSNSLDNIKMDVLYDKVGSTAQNGLNTEKRFPVLPSGNSKVMNIPGAPQSLDTSSKQEACNIDPEDEIDESNFGEPWVQGLTDGEYIDLSVEERLNALVSLIGVAIEGNSIRMVLEERLEAATALKKKLWAEAQLDKRRFKEDYSGKLQYSSLNGVKSEMAQTTAVTEGGSQTPQHIVNNRCSDGNVNPASEDLFHDPNHHSNIHTAPFVERKLSGQEFVANTEGDLLQQSAHAAEKSRSQLKSYVGYKAEEVYQYRSLPLGQDRRRNRYWLFAESTSRDDPGSGRIFFESRDGFWRLIDSEEAFDELLAALDTRGVRESHLHSMLQRIETSFKETIRSRKISNSSVNLAGSLVKTGVTETTARPDCSRGYDSPSSTLCGLTPDTVGYSSSFKIELGRNQMERSTITKRYTGFEKWMWKECYSPILCAMKYGTKRCPELLQTCNLCYQSYFSEEKHCPSCHKTFRSFHAISANFEEHVSHCQEKRRADPSWKSHVSDSSISIGICLIKAQLSLIEATLPVDALQSFWTEGYRKTWGVKLLSSSSAEELLQVLSLLEGAIKRESLSSDFETTSELLSSISGSGAGDLSAISGSVPVLPWIPDTTAALALRLRDLDSSISYTKMEPHKEKEAGLIMKLPSRYTFVKNVQELEPADTLDQLDYQIERKWIDPGSGRRGRGRGSRGGGLGRGRGRGRGGRGRGRGSRSSTRAEITDAFGNAIDYEKATRKYTRRGRARGRGRMRGRRTLRPRQVQDYRLDAERIPQFGGFNDIGCSVRQDSSESSPRSLGANRWRIEKTGTPYIEDDYNNAGFQSDENGQASEDESDDDDPVDYARNFGRGKTIGMIDDDYEDDEDEEMEDDEIPSRHVVDTDVDEYEEDMGDDDEDDMEVGGERNEDEDQGASYSSEYSD